MAGFLTGGAPMLAATLIVLLTILCGATYLGYRIDRVQNTKRFSRFIARYRSIKRQNKKKRQKSDSNDDESITDLIWFPGDDIEN